MLDAQTWALLDEEPNRVLNKKRVSCFVVVAASPALECDAKLGKASFPALVRYYLDIQTWEDVLAEM